MLLPREPAWRKVATGLEMEVSRSDAMDVAFYAGTASRKLVWAVQRLVRAGDVCFDMGAHKGYITLLMARLVGSSGRIWAFEPDPRAVERLRRNSERNRLHNIVVHPIALGATQATGSLQLAHHSGWSSLHNRSEVELEIVERIQVEIRPLDSLTYGESEFPYEKVSFVKIDCEGSETEILRGMARFLERSDPVLWVEVHPGALHAAGSSTRELLDLLVRDGYEVFALSWWPSAYVPRGLRLSRVVRHVFQPQGSTDVMAFRPSRVSLLSAAGFLTE